VASIPAINNQQAVNNRDNKDNNPHLNTSGNRVWVCSSKNTENSGIMVSHEPSFTSRKERGGVFIYS